MWVIRGVFILIGCHGAATLDDVKKKVAALRACVSWLHDVVGYDFARQTVTMRLGVRGLHAWRGRRTRSDSCVDLKLDALCSLSVGEVASLS